MILGFGKTEETVARDILQECYNAIERDKEISSIEAIESVRAKYNKLYDEYGQMDASEVPERYSCFWAYESGEYFRFTFHHINRRHPFSNDGWAMLKSTWILEAKTGKIFMEG